MRAFVIHAPERYGLADMPTPQPGPDEVLVAPAAVGICGSDLELLSGHRPSDYARYPVVPGHEWSGHVVACGAQVVGLEPGTPVVAEGVAAAAPATGAGRAAPTCAPVRMRRPDSPTPARSPNG